MVFMNVCVLVLWMKVASEFEGLTLVMLSLLFCPSYNIAEIVDNHVNPVILVFLVFIGKPSLSTIRWVLICQVRFLTFSNYFVLSKSATSSTRVIIASLLSLASRLFFASDVYMLGGYDGTEIYGDIWKLNLKTYKWTKLAAQMPKPSYFHSAAITSVSCVVISEIILPSIYCIPPKSALWVLAI